MKRRDRGLYGSRPDLDIADWHKLETAEGLHMLGQLVDCATEVERISPAGWEHPMVLHLAARVYSELLRTRESLDCVERFIQAAPNHPFGYCLKNVLLTYLGRSREAYDLLLGVIDHFPAHGTMQYELAQRAAECELWDEARRWIYRAICIHRHLKIGALLSKSLRPIHGEIEGMNPGN